MPFGLTRGEILLIAFIFGLVYSAGLLPRLAARLSGARAKDTKQAKESKERTE